MKKQQLLINSQVEINRAVFEVNRQYNDEKVRPDYMQKCVSCAIKSLNEFYVANFGKKPKAK
jgi:hypothetical protein